MDPSLYILFIFLFLLSGFFSGTEIALMSLPKHKIESLLKQRLFGAKALAHIRKDTDQLLSTILIGNNLVNVYTASLATQIALSIATKSGMEQSLAIAISTGIITLLILIFGEIVPKSFAIKNAEKIGLLVAYPYKILMLIMYPATFLLGILIRLFTGKNVATKITDEEIETFIDLGKESGTLEEGEHERLKNTLEFSDTLIEEVMVPRVKVDALSAEVTIREALEYYLRHTHSRIPVYKGQIDKIVGIINIRDILREQQNGNESKKLKDLHFKKFLKTPINQPIDIMLETFKKTRQHIAIVMDEYGGVAGIVTIEDIIEEIFGEIHDETDFETDEIIEKDKGTFIIHSTILLDDIVDEFGLDLADIGVDEKEFGSETVSYMITHQLERFPEAEEYISFGILDDDRKKTGKKLCFTVIDIEDSTIGKVEVTIK